MSKTYSKTRIMVECALMIAVGMVLSNIKIFSMPNGGSVTLLSMLPFVLVSFRHGVKWGLFTGFVNGCLQMIMGVAVGTALAGFLRFLCSFLSGVLVWGNLSDGLSAWTYSLVYNGSYMLPETLLTVVGAILLIKAAPQIFDRQNAKA